MANDRPLPPIFLLAYANERVELANHLRNLSDEINRIRDTLKPAEIRGYCQVLFEPNASADRIFSIFQDPYCRNRIAVFHYAGHANNYQLLLETASSAPSPINSEGLAAFLGQQRALELVFLNGCSTVAQAQGLLDAKVKAVIATSEAIDDTVAMDFAVSFYNGLAGNANLEQSYNEAAAIILSKKGTNYRSLYWGGSSTTKDVISPWKFLTQSNQSARYWNLPEAAGDWLQGVPIPLQKDLPQMPYLGWHWYSAQHAELFFGRSKEIRYLYDLLTVGNPDSPIVLIYGASGVGKSSLIEAGLVPRLSVDSDVRHKRRESNLNLAQLLAKILQFEKDEISKGAWRRLEYQKPLFVILDQVEGVFLADEKGRREELDNLGKILHTLLEDRENRPRGRLVLGFRKEWLAEIKDWLTAVNLNNLYVEVLIHPMGRDSVEEVINGPTHNDRLKAKYNLTVHKETTRAILERIVSDERSAVAPTLQILLTNMWEVATRRSESSPQFDNAVFSAVTKGFSDTKANTYDQKLLLDEFLGQLLGDVPNDPIKSTNALPAPQSLRDLDTKAVDSGLALDLLMLHTTEIGTAAEITLDNLKNTYSHHSDSLETLISRCKDLFLLTEPTPRPGESGQEEQRITTTRLGHDTLAPLIRNRFLNSDRPGQRARRILESRAVDWINGRTGPLLSNTDLAIVKAGEFGMRVMTKDEKRLVKASHDKIIVLRIILIALIILVIFLVAFAGYQWNRFIEQSIIVDAETMRADRQTRETRARFLISQSSKVRDRYPQRALLLAIEAIKRPLEADQVRLGSAETLLRDLIDSIGGVSLGGYKEFYKIFTLAPNGKWLATAKYNTGVTLLWRLDHPLDPPRHLSGHNGNMKLVVFDPQGRWLATAETEDETVQLWDLNAPESEPIKLSGHKGIINKLAFDPQGRWLATAGTEDGTVQLWDLNAPKFEPIILSGHRGVIGKLAFEPQGRWLVTVAPASSSVQTLQLWDLQHRDDKPIRELPFYDVSRNRIAFQGHWLVIQDDIQLTLLDLNQPQSETQKLGGFPAFLKNVQYDPMGRWLTVITDTDVVYLYDLDQPQPKPKELFKYPVSRINDAKFDLNGHFFGIGSSDGVVRLWNLESPTIELKVLPSQVWDISSLEFSPSSDWLATVNSENEVILWDLHEASPLPKRLEWKSNIVRFDPLGQRLAMGDDSGVVRLLDINRHILGQSQELRGEEGELRAIDFVAKSHNLLTQAADGSVRLWNLDQSDSASIVMLGHKSVVNAHAFEPSGHRLATGSNDGTVCLWDLDHPRNEPLETFEYEGPVMNLRFDPTGRWLATVNKDGSDYVLSLRDFNRPLSNQPTVLSRQKYLEFISFAPQGRWLAAYDKINNRAVRLWNLDQKYVRSEPDVIQPINDFKDLRFTHQGDALVTVGWDGSLNYWDLDPFKFRNTEPNKLETDTKFFDFDPQGRWLATAHGNGLVYLKKLKQQGDDAPGPVLGIHGSSFLYFEPQGPWLVSVGKTGKYIDFVDMRKSDSFVLQKRSLQNIGPTPIVRFHRDGGWALAGSSDNRNSNNRNGGTPVLELWDLENPDSESISIRTLRHLPTTWDFDLHGRWLVIGSRDGSVTLLHRDVSALLDIACRKAGRNLTLEEWDEYGGTTPKIDTCPMFNG